jgi:hypothetical protein
VAIGVAAGVAVVAAVALLGTGTGPGSLVRAWCYLGLGVGLPGLVLVRAATGRPRRLLVDGSLGAAVGYVVEVFGYLAARAAGHPLALVAWPVLVIGLSLGWPWLRHRVWHRSTDEPAPAWFSWGLGGLAVASIAFLAVGGFATSPLSGPGATAPYSDTPFHLALVGELKHHLPAVMPYVQGQPLAYHWFVHAHLAAASWVSGVEPVVLLTRTELLPLAVLAVLLVGVLGQRISGSPGVGLLAATIATLGGPVLAQRWSSAPFGSIHLLVDSAWASPSQAYGAVIFLAVLVVATDVLRPPDRAGAGPIVLLAVLIAGASGAKATVVPLLGCGLALVVAVGLLRRSWATVRPALLPLAATAAVFVVSVVVLFGGQTQGLTLKPLLTVAQLPAARTLGAGPIAGVPISALLALLVLTLISWLAAAAGVLALGRRLVLDPACLLLAGVGVAGLAATLLAVQPGVSQVYFVRTAMPALAVLSGYGLVRLAGSAGRLIPAGLVGGAALALLMALAGPAHPRILSPQRTGWRPALLHLAAPYAALLAVLAVTLAAGVVLARRRGRSAAPVAAVVLAAVVGLGLPVPFWQGAVATADVLSGAAGRPVAGRPTMPSGGVTAARWLRDNSGPDDLVATNAHCWSPTELPGRTPRCDVRNFWISGYAERRVLVEGWAYTVRANEPYTSDLTFNVLTAPFWDDALLATNDAAFTTPSAATISTLRDRYGVRWLFVDRRIHTPVGDVGRWATLRFSAADCDVYSISSGP